MTWKPRPREGVDHLALPLDPLQGYLLSRLDGTLDVPALASVMNLGEDQVTAMLGRLVALGAVASAVPLARPTAASPVQASPEPPSEPVPAEPEAATTEDTETAEARMGSATHRQLFEERLHARPVDERAALARAAAEPELSACCFDPTAEVIRALLENPRTGTLQARLIATHHRTSAGLDALGARAAFAGDDGVRRALLQNPILPPALFRRLWAPRRLLEQYLVSASHDSPEQIRAMARDLLRSSFNQRTGEERVELILTTEGRCLMGMQGLTLDSQATALMCRRTYVSTLLIQNLARWSAAPPALIAHLRRQDIVKRNPVLRQLLERHPNAS
ncbi:MAG: hypothetical protein IPP58_07975 [Holophagaceae bacterium]|uniref:Uncharacterized protein n=1 Tax=Candidatus Geothrix skivensis TaxID=2954439 RepID=A0A9D7SHQ9_9BACT|nr:hypothetical protein [Candidatus Geothrix skivensis]